MFKFLHAADVHLDSPLRGLARVDEAPVDSIRGATRRAFENLVELAIEERVAFVLLAGDLYDGDWKDYSTGIFMARQLGRLGQHGIRVIAVAGNHDAASKITKVLDPPDNMTILSTKKPATVVLDDLEPPVAIHGQGYPRPHVEENLAAGYPDTRAGLFNIGLLHTSLDGRPGHADYAPCRVDDLRARGYQYWALGHVHLREVVSEDPWIVFPGCIQGRHIRETEPKGCMLVTVGDDAVVTVEPIDLDVLRWVRLGVDVEDAADQADVLARVRQQLVATQDDADGRPVAVRVRLEGATLTADELAADPERLVEQLRAMAAEVGGDDLWIEKVELDVRPKRDLEATLAGDNALGALFREIRDLREEPAAVRGLEAEIAVLKAKLPPEAVGADVDMGAGLVLDLDDPKRIGRLVGEAKQLLVGRLLSEGGDS